jgi:hypothetical protein
MIRVPNDAELQVLSFVRRNETDGVFAVFNLSDAPRDVTFRGTVHLGSWEDGFNGARVEIDADTRLAMDPWEWRVLVRGGGR